MIIRWLFIFSTLFTLSLAIKWLAIHQISPPWNDSSQCPTNKTERRQFGLVTHQTKICKRTPEIMPILIKAAKQVVDVCQKTFIGDRWNCSSLLMAPNLKADLVKGTREQAFVFALSSAAITYNVAKACVNGDLPCSCGYSETTTIPGSISNPDTYKWKGCSDNVVYGKRISREWSDSLWRRTSPSALRKRKSILEFDPENLNEDPTPQRNTGLKVRMNQNNVIVGLDAVQKSLYRKCKCHGVSSSCDIKTCWNTLPNLQVIADNLKERYLSAHQLGQPYDTTGSKNDGRSTRVSSNTNSKEPELVFMRNSPNYCDFNLELGSLGTKDRECYHNSTDLINDEPSNCEKLCCGRGFNTQQFTFEERCKCKWDHSQYNIKCKICVNTVEKHYCK